MDIVSRNTADHAGSYPDPRVGGHAQAGMLIGLLAIHWTFRLGMTMRRKRDPEHGYQSELAKTGSNFYLMMGMRWLRTDKDFPSSIVPCFLALMGASIEFFFQGLGLSQDEDNWGHVMIYMLWAISFGLEILFWYLRRHAWIPFENVVPLMWAVTLFSMGWILFSHEMGKPMLEIAAHKTLSLAAFFTATVCLFESYSPRNELLALFRCAGLFTFSIYIWRFVVLLKGSYDYTPWDSDPNLGWKMMMVAIQFCLIMAFSILLVFIIIIAVGFATPRFGIYFEPTAWHRPDDHSSSLHLEYAQAPLREEDDYTEEVNFKGEHDL